MRNLFFSLFCFTFALAVHAEEANFTVHTVKNTEAFERNVDRAAIAAQDEAIAKMEQLLKRYRNTNREEAILYRLAELDQESAAIHFRVAHGSTHGRAADLSSFKKRYNDSIKALSELIKKYPKSDDIARAYFLRGHALEENEDKKAAAKDYLMVVKIAPEMPEAIQAWMSLAVFAIDDTKFAEAVPYLKKVEDLPNDPHYPFAIYRLAWCYYNLKQIPDALHYLEKHIQYYTEKNKEGALSTDEAIRDNSLADLSLFYLEGYEAALPDFTLEKAWDYFKKIDSGAGQGKMILRFAKLLRAHDHDEALEQWKAMVLDRNSEQPESAEILMLSFESEWDKHNYSKLAAGAQDVLKIFAKNPKLKETENYANAQKLLTTVTNGFRDLVVKNKEWNGVHDFGKTLEALTEAYLELNGSKSKQSLAAQYNLAETFFTIKDYSSATKYYKNVGDNGFDKINDAELKAIASRYEELKELHPKDITVMALSENSDSSLDPKLTEWLAWLATEDKKEITKKPELEAFLFEASRILYAQKHLQDATARLLGIAKNAKPDSKYAVPALSLLLDTYIKSNDWKMVNSLANSFLVPWEKSSFHERLASLAADSSVKLIEAQVAAGNNEAVLSMCDEFSKTYAKSPRSPDVLLLAASAAMKKEDSVLAEKYLQDLLKNYPKNENRSAALLHLATIRENAFDANSAYILLSQYAAEAGGALSAEKRSELNAHLLELAWIAKPNDILEKKSLCSASLKCAEYRALLEMDQKEEIDGTAELRLSIKEKESSLAVSQAMIALNSGTLNFYDELKAIEIVAKRFHKIEGPEQFLVSEKILRLLPGRIDAIRLQIARTNKLKGDEHSLKRRLALLQDYEATLTELMKFPYAELKAGILASLSAGYRDLGEELRTLPAPKDLSPKDAKEFAGTIEQLAKPVEQKSADLSQAVASLVAANLLLAPLNKEIPFASLRMPNLWESAKEKVLPISKEESEWRMAWSSALAERSWSKVLWILEKQSKYKLSAAHAALYRAATMEAMGARSAALGDWEEALQSMPKVEARDFSLVLLREAIGAQSEKKAKTYYVYSAEMPVENADAAFLVAYTADWLHLGLAPLRRQELLEKAVKSESSVCADWAKKALQVTKAQPVALLDAQ